MILDLEFILNLINFNDCNGLVLHCQFEKIIFLAASEIEHI